MIDTVYKENINSSKIAVSSVVALIQLTNQYLNSSKFWKLQSKQEQHGAIGLACEALRVISILLYPIIPRYSETLMGYFRVPQAERNLDYCKISSNTIVKYDPSITPNLFVKKLKHS